MIRYVLFSLILITSGSCINQKETKNNSETDVSLDTLELLKGTWTFTKEMHLKGKNVVWEGRPTVPQLTLGENAYFVLADRVTDEKMQKEGIPAIQERYKGQFIFEANRLRLDHFEEDSLIQDLFQIKKITSHDLIIEDPVKNRVWYLKK